MPFKIVRNDITKVKADVIVNTANPKPIYASGTDLAIYQAAGADELLPQAPRDTIIIVARARAVTFLSNFFIAVLLYINTFLGFNLTPDQHHPAILFLRCLPHEKSWFLPLPVV